MASGGVGFWNKQAATAAQELREDMAARKLPRRESAKDETVRREMAED